MCGGVHVRFRGQRDDGVGHLRVSGDVGNVLDTLLMGAVWLTTTEPVSDVVTLIDQGRGATSDFGSTAALLSRWYLRWREVAGNS